MGRDDLHFRLRIPETLKTRIEDAAKAHHRSMTAEIIARLESSFPSGDEELQAGPALSPADYHRAVADFNRKLAEIDAKLSSLRDWESLKPSEGEK